MINNINRPAPKWYRIAKPVYSQFENMVIAAWMIYSPADCPELLLFKVVSSFIKETLDIMLVSQTEEYTQKPI